jgi:hypothetical protein
MTRILLLILILLSLTGCTKKPLPSSAPKTNEPVNTVDIKDRPYVTLAPTVGGRHPLGQEVTLTIHTVTLGATSVEYELEYQAGTLLQGTFGTIDLTKDKPPVSKDLLFGSCSTGGKCAYHKDVSGGSLTLRFKGGSQNFNLKSEWNLQTMSDRQGKFSSRDGKFQLEVGKTGLLNNTFLVMIQTMGLPRPPAGGGEILAGPYGIFTNNVKLSGTAQLTLRLNQDASSAKLLGWDGQAWKEYKASLTDKTLTATIDKLTTFIVTSSP